jgi:RNA polymerase sigma-70 factor (ECF subfamily)
MAALDLELLERMRNGDEAAFVELYRRRQGAVYRFALQMTGNVVLAEDVTQETFLALLSGTARYEPERGSLASFLYGIARNQVLRRLERDRGAESESEAEEFPTGEDVLEDLTRQEAIEQVRRAVLSLPSSYREVVVLCDLHESSYEEAAAALDCPVGTVRSRLNRGRQMLARKLQGTAVQAAGRLA